jgi:hypothetical protein
MKNLLPQDTTSIDVMSLGYLIMILWQALATSIGYSGQWIILLSVLLVASIVTISLNTMTIFRIFLQWILGMVFTYIAISKIGTPSLTLDIAGLILGGSNLYACVVNFNLYTENNRDGKGSITHS